MKISVVVVSHNEADKLSLCLKSVDGWVDEIVVVDLGSSDSTKKIVDEFQARYVQHAFVPYVEFVRDFAIAQCSSDWILVLDPDEQIPITLKNYLLEFVRTHKTGVLNIPRKNVFFGVWIRHTNFWPDYQIRFFSKGTVVWKKILHSHPLTTLPATKVDRDESLAILHASYPTVKVFFERQKRYATLKARERYSAGERFSLWSLLYSTMREFTSRYVWHRGFLDMQYGIVLTVGLMYYACAVELKLLALQRR